MGETFAEGAPAVAAQDPANLSGPGVTQNPDNASQVFDVAAIAQQNAELRAQLIAENERLKAALADSRAAGVQAQGLSDEDVRMIEHPEEYDEAFATVGQHSILTDKLSALQARLDALDVQRQQQQAPDVAPQAVPQPGAAQVTADPLAPVTDGSATSGDGSSVGVVTPSSPATVTPANVDLSSLTDAELSAELARREASDTTAPGA